jgi:glycosyltransferase involved in cell wall biosynthesis
LFLHPSNEAYGSDRMLHRLVLGLEQRGWQVRVLLSSDQPDGWLSRELERRDVEVRRGPLAPARRRYLGARSLVKYLRLLVDARRWIRAEANGFGADIIHVNTSALLVGALIGRPGGARVVWHVHELIRDPKPLRLVFQIAPVFADKVVVVSRAVGENLRPRLIARRRMQLVPNGIEDLALAPVTGDRDLIVFVGRINAWKGWDIFLKAIPEVARSHPSARYLIVGSPPPGEEAYTSKLTRLAEELGVIDLIDVRGFVENVSEVIEEASVVVVPSVRPEPFGLVTLEAMRAAKAVVASAHGGSLDLIEPGISGILVPPGDAEALSQSVLQLLKNPALRRALGERARERMLKEFSFEPFIRRMEELYLELVPTRTRVNGGSIDD